MGSKNDAFFRISKTKSKHSVNILPADCRSRYAIFTLLNATAPVKKGASIMARLFYTRYYFFSIFDSMSYNNRPAREIVVPSSVLKCERMKRDIRPSISLSSVFMSLDMFIMSIPCDEASNVLNSFSHIVINAASSFFTRHSMKRNIGAYFFVFRPRSWIFFSVPGIHPHCTCSNWECSLRNSRSVQSCKAYQYDH